MVLREKLFIGFLGLCVLILTSVGIVAFLQGDRLLENRRLADEENRRGWMLQKCAGEIRDLPRRSYDAALSEDEASAKLFRKSVATLEELGRAIKARPEAFGGTEQINVFLADLDAYISDYRKIAEEARSDGMEIAWLRANVIIKDRRLDRILATLLEMQDESAERFAQQSIQISEATRYVLLATGALVGLAIALILVSAAAMLHLFHRIQSLLGRTVALNRDLEHGKKEMESMLSFVSHDLRAPLVNVKGFSGTISDDTRRQVELLGGVEMPVETARELDDILRDRTPEALEFIHLAADSMERLITTMVKVARAGQIPVHPQPIDANRMVGEIVRDFEYRIKDSGATVEVEGLPPCVADPDQVRQVFSNIIDNAIKYREPSRPLHLRITGSLDADQSTYCFEDNGVGIVAEDLRNITEMYYQVKDKAAGGEGLGLAIARKMIERNGGTLEVESEAGCGSKFIVKLRATGAKHVGKQVRRGLFR